MSGLALATELAKTRERAYKAEAEVERLRAALGHYRWRPISEIHEDYGSCVLMHLEDPGYLEIGTNLDVGFDESQWTHFTEVPKLSHTEAQELLAALEPKP